MLASAIATGLTEGMISEAAIERAKKFVSLKFQQMLTV
jgi:hydroxymethylpyrimidine/phosphomethylpyrimidine kinase